jgi:hypothetical protein
MTRKELSTIPRAYLIRSTLTSWMQGPHQVSEPVITKWKAGSQAHALKEGSDPEAQSCEDKDAA